MDKLLQLEEELSFQQFTHENAYQFGQNVLEIVKTEHYKPVRIRVRYEDDIIFQYLMDGKKGEEWLNRKERTVLESQHSSLYVYENQKDYSYMIDNENYAVCGGGFPLIVQGQIKGVFCVSGLRHDEDHDLIIKALKRLKP